MAHPSDDLEVMSCLEHVNHLGQEKPHEGHQWVGLSGVFMWCPELKQVDGLEDILNTDLPVDYSEQHDPVNHPQHYNKNPSGVECIDVIEHMNLCRGTAIKYIWRAGEKDPDKEIEDLEKAIWYIEREIVRLKVRDAI